MTALLKTIRPVCGICSQKPAERYFTWVNQEGSGVGGGLHGERMCFDCMRDMSDALSRFPVARDTVTIWPLDNEMVAEELAKAAARLRGGDQ